MAAPAGGGILLNDVGRAAGEGIGAILIAFLLALARPRGGIVRQYGRSMKLGGCTQVAASASRRCRSASVMCSAVQHRARVGLTLPNTADSQA